VEERSVQPVNRDLANFKVCHAGDPGHLDGFLLDRLHSLLLIDPRLCRRGVLVADLAGAHDGPAHAPLHNLGEAEHALPPVVDAVGPGPLGRKPEAGRDQRPLGPPVLDAGQVPVHHLGGGVAVELVAHVHQLLHRRHIDIVDGAEIQDHSLQRR